MARPLRLFLPGHPQHIIQRGNDRARVFFGASDYAFYLTCLGKAFARYRCDLHAYVLMTNHVHLLATPAAEESLPRAMQWLGSRYAQFINWRRERTGTLWEGRPRASIVDRDAYFLACTRYIELNPVRAGMVAGPGDYPWSSFGANAAGRSDPLVKPHPLYLSLGSTPAKRSEAYRTLFDTELSASVLADIREATQKGWPLGDRKFRDAVQAATRRRANPLRRGGVRPGCGRPGEKSIGSDPIDLPKRAPLGRLNQPG
jgi:putative transposase